MNLLSTIISVLVFDFLYPLAHAFTLGSYVTLYDMLIGL